MQSCPVSDLAVPNLLYSRFGAGKSDTQRSLGTCGITTTFQYQFKIGIEWYLSLICVQSCPVSDSAVPNLQYSRFGGAESDTETSLGT